MKLYPGRVAAFALTAFALFHSLDQSIAVEKKAAPEVRRSLKRRGNTQLIVALRGRTGGGVDIPGFLHDSGSIKQIQEDVISKLPRGKFKVKHRFKNVAGFVLTTKDEDTVKALEKHPNVAMVDLDVGGTVSLAQSVPLINADQRQKVGNRGDGVVVAVLDSGYDSDHPDLVGKGTLIHEACFLDDDGTVNGSGDCPNGSDRQFGKGAAEDDDGHGTHVASIISSNGVQAPVGVAPDANIVAIKVTNREGFFFFASEIVAALDYLIANPQLGVNIINMSVGTFTQFAGVCDFSTSFGRMGAEAINTLRNKGVIAFASTGNEGSTTEIGWPGCLSQVIAVASSNDDDSPSFFTNSNMETDLFAPGNSIMGSKLGGGANTRSGTSMASPHVAACAALLIQDSNGTITPDEIEERLKNSTVFITREGKSFPRVDCKRDSDRETTKGPFPIGFAEVTCNYRRCLNNLLKQIDSSKKPFGDEKLERYLSNSRAKIVRGEKRILDPGDALVSLSLLQQAMKWNEIIGSRGSNINNDVAVFFSEKLGRMGSFCATDFVDMFINAFMGEGILDDEFLSGDPTDLLNDAQKDRAAGKWVSSVKKSLRASRVLLTELGERFIPNCDDAIRAL